MACVTLSHVRTENFSNDPKTSMLLPQQVEAVSKARVGHSFLYVGTRVFDLP
jgi:hypothetical protein